jgi:hypothetical protein
MKTVEFIQNKSIGMEAYNCGCNFVGDKYCQINHSGTYVLASEANAEVDKAKAEWIERCRKFREQDSKEATERIKVLEDALKAIAKQNLESEMHEDDIEDADYRGAYDCLVRVARAALEVKP